MWRGRAAGMCNDDSRSSSQLHSFAITGTRLKGRSIRCSSILFAAIVLLAGAGFAQTPTQADPSGDVVADPGPVAHLSPALKPGDVRKAIRKVADWQLNAAESRFSLDWTYAALYDGLLAASRATGDLRYHDAVMHFAERSEWKLGPRFGHADDEAVAQSYLELDMEHPAPERVAAIQAEADKLLARPDDPAKDLWWWCDALFMGPPVWARLYRATGEKLYLDYMDREWWITSNLLYDPQEHLYFRDASYLQKTEAKGKKLFWSRGNGWVMASLARVLEEIPEDYPTRPKYVEQYRQMAERVTALQGADGLWRSGLLNADAYPLPEVSGSAFFVYSLAWGVDHGLLDRATYLPVVQKGWKGLVSHIYVDGRLGCIQPIGGAPGDFKPSSSYVYGVGAFLLAGSEVDGLSQGKSAPHGNAH